MSNLYVVKLVGEEISGRFGFMNFNKSEEDLERVLKKPWVMTSSDGRVHAPYGVLGKIPSVHPRYYGTFPRVLGRYAREKNLLSLEEATRKMTSMKTQRLGIFDRGLIADGMWADVTIFDPDTVIDRARPTPREETKRYPEGVPYVIVNGVITVEEGGHTEALARKVLRKRR